MKQRRIMQDLTSMPVFRKCRHIWEERRSSMRSGVFPRTIQDWNSGKMERFPENRNLYMKTMRCRYFIGMSCTNQEKRVKTRPAWNFMMVMTGNGSAQVCFIRIWSTCAGTGPEKSLLLRFWKNDIRNIISAFLIQKKLHYQKHL